MNQPLDLELLRCSFQFLDRKQLLILSAGSNQRINLLIQREFGNTAPYFSFERLEIGWNMNKWQYKVNAQSALVTPPDQKEFVIFLTTYKFIRYRKTLMFSDDGMSLDFLKSISHVWIEQELSIDCDQIRPSPELYRLISSSAVRLTLTFPEVFSILGEPFIQNDRYKFIRLHDETLYEPNEEFPYVSNIVEFLFSSDANSRKELYVTCCYFALTVQYRIRITNAIKQVGFADFDVMYNLF
ncbi:hypothetical protein Ddc_12633 [Ditylenchus destructor]|nr:hypothetical protein Ddc_12633 [Ditylenchus destructor]